MPNLKIAPTWTLEVNNDELLLILKALGGRLSKDKAEAAAKLGDELTATRAKQLEDQADMLKRALVKPAT